MVALQGVEKALLDPEPNARTSRSPVRPKGLAVGGSAKAGALAQVAMGLLQGEHVLRHCQPSGASHLDLLS
eukprot:9216833-Pyramimonas_sp.AAC.1